MEKLIVMLAVFLVIIGLGVYKIYDKLKKAPGELCEMKKMKLESEKNVGVMFSDPKASKPEVAEDQKGGVNCNGQTK